jgi:hypothetical protein
LVWPEEFRLNRTNAPESKAILFILPARRRLQSGKQRTPLLLRPRWALLLRDDSIYHVQPLMSGTESSIARRPGPVHESTSAPVPGRSNLNKRPGAGTRQYASPPPDMGAARPQFRPTAIQRKRRRGRPRPCLDASCIRAAAFPLERLWTIRRLTSHIGSSGPTLR